MIDSTTCTAVCTRLAAPDRHPPSPQMGPAMYELGVRRPASTIHAHPTMPAVESTI
jgi:hypothetical protein